MKNICFQLNQFIMCSQYEYIVFCWVMHEQSIIDSILFSLDTNDCFIKSFSLIADKHSLANELPHLITVQSDVVSKNRITSILAGYPRTPIPYCRDYLSSGCLIVWMFLKSGIVPLVNASGKHLRMILADPFKSALMLSPVLLLYSPLLILLPENTGMVSSFPYTGMESLSKKDAWDV